MFITGASCGIGVACAVLAAVDTAPGTLAALVNNAGTVSPQARLDDMIPERTSITRSPSTHWTHSYAAKPR